jgi:hypothetical protein
MRQFYTTVGFYNWELNARNLLSEIGGVIGNGKEYALRDAIGIAYNPYNRIAWNKYALPLRRNGEESNLYEPNKGVKVHGDRYYDFDAILLSGTQYGISTREFTAWGGDYLGTSREKIYEVALIIAYAVSKRYFVDTSFGATEYLHKPPGTSKYMSCTTDGPAFFTRSPYERGPEKAITSDELWAQQGWGNGYANLVPKGCKLLK